jgi:hypothetical protein
MPSWKPADVDGAQIPPAFIGFLLSLLLDSADGGDMFLRTTQRYNSEDRTSQNDCREKLKYNTN